MYGVAGAKGREEGAEGHSCCYFPHQILIPLKSSMPRLPPTFCFCPPSSTAVLPIPIPQGPGLWLVIHSKTIMGDKKLMATQSVNGYSNQITTSNILANSLAIHPTLASRNRVMDIAGWPGRYSASTVQFHWPKTEGFLPDVWLLLHDVLKEDTLHSASIHAQWKPDLWLLFSWVSITTHTHLMSSWGWWGE